MDMEDFTTLPPFTEAGDIPILPGDGIIAGVTPMPAGDSVMAGDIPITEDIIHGTVHAAIVPVTVIMITGMVADIP